jgi:hypothetical protein
VRRVKAGLRIIQGIYIWNSLIIRPCTKQAIELLGRMADLPSESSGNIPEIGLRDGLPEGFEMFEVIEDPRSGNATPSNRSSLNCE